MQPPDSRSGAIDPASVSLLEAGGLSTLAFSGVRTQVIGDMTHLLFYVAQPASDGGVEYVIIGRLAAPTSTVLLAVETISTTIAHPQFAASTLGALAN